MVGGGPRPISGERGDYVNETNLPLTLWMRPWAMVKQILPNAAGGLIGLVVVSLVSGTWHVGVVLGVVLGTFLVCSVSRIQLTETSIILRRGWSRASRRWVDLALQEKGHRVRFIVFDEKEDEPGQAWRSLAPGDYERDWQRGRIGRLLRDHQPELMAEVEARGSRA